MTNKAKIYLYKEGNECTTITGGGWTYSNSGYGSGTIQFVKNTDNIYMEVKGANNGNRTLTCYPTSITSISNIRVGKIYWDAYIWKESKTEIQFNVNGSIKQSISNSETLQRETRPYDVNGLISSVQFAYHSNSNNGYRATSNLYGLYIETDSDIITVPSYNQGSLSINLNSLGNLLSFKNLTFSWNGTVLNTYDNISARDIDIEYALDDSAMFYGDNEVTIQVTYNQGDGLPDEVLTMTYVYNKCVILETVDEQIPDLVANTSPREFLDRIYMVNDVINKNRDNMYKLLEYKGFQVEENLRLNDLIILVWNMIYEGSVEETIRQKMITVLRNKGIEIVGDETISELIDIVNTKL